MAAHTQTHTSVPFADRTATTVPLVGGMLALVVLAFLFQPSMGNVFDIDIYHGIGERLARALHGFTSPLGSEYPPLATIAFWAAYANPFGLAFETAWLWMVVAFTVLATLYATFVLRDAYGWLIAAAVAGTVFLVGPELVFARYDSLVVLLLLLCLRARGCGRFGQCGAFLAVACALKVVPALCIPILFATAPRTKWKRMIAGFAIGLAASFALPAAIMGVRLTFENMWHMIDYHRDRSVQLESMWSSMHILLKFIVGQRAQIGGGHMSVINGDLGTTVLPFAKALIVATAVGVSAIAYVRRSHAHADTLTIAVLLLSMALSPVFSPQYVVWVLPLLLVWLALHYRKRCNPGVLFGVALLTATVGFATQWVFPMHYDWVIDQMPMAIVILNVRNVAVLLLGIVLCRHVFTLSQRYRRPDVTACLSRLTLDATMVLVAVVLLQGYHREFVPQTSALTYTLSDGMHGSAGGLPFVIKAPSGTFEVRTEMTFASVPQDGMFQVKPDDCIDSLVINGTPVPNIAFCDDNRTVNLTGFFTTGRNEVSATLRNKGGPAGFILKPASLGLLPFSVASGVLITIGLFALSCWQTMVAWMSVRKSLAEPSGIRADVRLRAHQLLHLPLLDLALPA